MTRNTRSTASVYEHLARNPRKVCAPGGFITLVRSHASGMRMTWRDATDPNNVATRYLEPG